MQKKAKVDAVAGLFDTNELNDMTLLKDTGRFFGSSQFRSYSKGQER